MALALRVHLTGRMCVESGDEVLEASAFPGRQGRLAFAYLAANHHPVPRDELAEVVWGELLPKSWERDLSAVMSKLKALLVKVGLAPETLASAVGCYELRLPPDTFIDLEAARPLLEEAEGALRAGTPERGFGAASAAANLARRPFLPGEEGKWIEKRRDEMRGLAARALDILIDVHRGRGELAEALRYASDAIELEPYRESGYVAAMQLHLAAGNRAEALRTYERCRRLLAEELGVPPSPETEAVYLEALRADLDQAPPVAPPSALPAKGIVTFLFTDLVGSTELLEQLGTERAEKLRRAHFGLLRDAVATRGGEEVKNLGDGLMVAFASAVDAVECAIAMQQGVQRHNAHGDGPALSVRIGLHVGEPIRDEGDYFGTPVVVAKRLCDAARGGAILVSDLVRGLVGEDRGIEFGPSSAVDLKGLSAAVSSCEVGWAPLRTEAPPLPSTLARAGRFVGRRAEMEQMTNALGDPAVRLVLVAGDPGIGKTTLVTEAARQASDGGAAVLYGRCDEEALAPYQPFVEALAHAIATLDVEELRAHAGSGAASLARIVPELEVRLGQLPDTTGVEPEMERYRLFEAVAGFLAGLGASRPVAVLLDDLHWADRPTLLLLRHVLRAAPTGVTVIGTYRDSELSRTQPLAEVLPELRRIERLVRIGLRGLSMDETAELVGDRSGSALVHEVTEGNPLFVRQIVEHTEETGGSLNRLTIPEGVREVIGRRLSRLSAETNAVLHTAAVIGRDFDLGLLARISGESESAVLGRLEEALDAGVVVEVVSRADRFSFAHALMRETLADELSGSRRLRLHAGIADAIEALHGDDPAWATDLARHACEGVPVVDGARAAAAAQRAGRLAFEQLAFEDAEQLFQTALEVVAPADDEARLSILLDVGRAAAPAGRTASFQRAYEDAAELAARLDRPDDLVTASLGYTYLTLSVGGGNFDTRAIKLLERTLASIPADHPSRCRLVARLSAEIAAVDSVRAQELADEAAAMLTSTTDEVSAFEARYCALMTTRDTSVPIADRRSAADDLVELAAASTSVESELRARVYQIEFAAEAGDFEAIRRSVADFQTIAENHRLSAFRWFPSLWRTMLAIKDGHLADADGMSRATFELGLDSQGEVAAGVHFFVQRMLIRREQDRLAELIPLIEGFASEGTGEVVRRFAIITMAWICTECGRTDDAARVLDGRSPREIYGEVNALNWLQMSSLLLDAYGATGADKETAALYDELLPFADRFAWDGWVTVTYGSVERFLGVGATALERWDAADGHFRRAIEANTRIETPPWVAQTHLDHARMLLQRGRPADRDQATGHLGEAARIAEELSLTRIARQVRECGA